MGKRLSAGHAKVNAVDKISLIKCFGFYTGKRHQSDGTVLGRRKGCEQVGTSALSFSSSFFASASIIRLYIEYNVRRSKIVLNVKIKLIVKIQIDV